MKHWLLNFFATTAWWGKLLGAFFGYLIGRAPGAVIGILIGNIFDRGIAEHLSRPYMAYRLEKDHDVQSIFLQAVFLILGFIAKSDGLISKAEISFASNLMHHLGLSTQARLKARADFQTGKTPTFNPDDILSRLLQCTQNRRELLNTFLNIQYEGILCEPLTPLKHDAINYVFKRLGLAPLTQQFRFYQDFAENIFFHRDNEPHAHSQHDDTRTPRNTALSQAYALLSVTPASTQKEVKRAYRRLISQHHPDRLIARGAPDHEIKIGNEKTQCITKAYEQICQAKGWS